MFAPTVMEKILHEGLNAEGGQGFRLGGERRTVTILMSDIRDFTKRTEESSAEAIVDVLNRTLNTWSPLWNAMMERSTSTSAMH